MFITTAEWHRGCRGGPQAEAFSSVASPYPRLLAMRPSLSLLPSSLDHLTSAITSYHPDIVITLRSSWKNHRPIPRHHVSTTAAELEARQQRSKIFQLKNQERNWCILRAQVWSMSNILVIGGWVGGREWTNTELWPVNNNNAQQHRKDSYQYGQIFFVRNP